MRQALVDAVDGDTIDFSVTGTITLTSGQLVVDKTITISGPGASNLSVDGNHATRVFWMNPGKTVTISGLTITNGHDCYAGGGIHNYAVLTVNDSTISGNSAGTYGGGFVNEYSATLTVNNSTISGNSSQYVGGGIANDSIGTLVINNSTFSGNLASYGGGIFNYGYVYSSATLTINNSTFSGNSGSSGGGIYNSYATVTIGNTILNAGTSGQNIYNNQGTVTSLGYNLSSDDASAFLNQTGDLNMTDPMLGPLQDNGGPTFTHELLTGSPAIDSGDPSFTPPPDYDQRGVGFNRVVNGRVDMGAFEVQTIVCPQPQGYWRNNPDLWPVNSLTLGGQTYTETELLGILRSPARADASLILAFQLIAAKLNIANGANGTPVTSTILDADEVLSLYSGNLPFRVKPNSTNGQRMVNDGAVLENYNNGLLTPGCTPTPTPTPSPTP